jgi:hypothetical protein
LSPALLRQTQTHPDPKTAPGAAAASNLDFISSIDPKDASIRPVNCLDGLVFFASDAGSISSQKKAVKKKKKE